MFKFLNFFKKNNTDQQLTTPGHSKSDFLRFWGENGYTENFDGYTRHSLDSYLTLLKSYYNKSQDCLEIGCGSGYWTTNHLAPNFRTVTAIDLLPMGNRQFPKNVKYIELEDRDYNCTGIQDETIDFVFSFGVLCHLPNSALRSYAASIYRKLRPGGRGLLMFADFKRHFTYSTTHFPNEENIIRDKSLQDKHRERTDFHGWYYCDRDTLDNIFKESLFSKVNDVTPDEFRDCILEITK